MVFIIFISRTFGEFVVCTFRDSNIQFLQTVESLVTNCTIQNNVWLIFCNQCVELILSIFRYRTSAERFPIIVSQDCGHGPTADVVKAYGSKVTHLQVQSNRALKISFHRGNIILLDCWLCVSIWFFYVFVIHSFMNLSDD
jgi:hypothetical protein